MRGKDFKDLLAIWLKRQDNRNILLYNKFLFWLGKTSQ